MKVGTKEFYHMQDEFERSIKKSKHAYVTSLERTDGSVKGVFYENGKTNELFHVFMLGYSSGRLAYMLEG